MASFLANTPPLSPDLDTAPVFYVEVEDGNAGHVENHGPDSELKTQILIQDDLEESSYDAFVEFLQQKTMEKNSTTHNPRLGGTLLQSNFLTLAIIQTSLLVFVLVMVIIWAFTCKNRSTRAALISEQMTALARKISSKSSKDLPPAYSKVDLTSVGLSINDHFNPPPTYERALQYPEMAPPHYNTIFRSSLANGLTLSGFHLYSDRRSVWSLASSYGHLNRNLPGQVTFNDHAVRKWSSKSLPPQHWAQDDKMRKKSAKSEGPHSRKVSFADICFQSSENDNDCVLTVHPESTDV